MKNQELRDQLESNGYSISIVMSTGNYVAKKGQQTYIAESIKDLYKKILN